MKAYSWFDKNTILDLINARLESIEDERDANFEQEIQKAIENSQKFWFKIYHLRKNQFTREEAIEHLKIPGRFISRYDSIYHFSYGKQYDFLRKMREFCETTKEDKIFLDSEAIDILG